ncbi:MAG: hypothetical protein NTX45_12710 [Proteobacteria bacterium]|nr:hypothetical protein [Pseudomonadota bacterium]
MGKKSREKRKRREARVLCSSNTIDSLLQAGVGDYRKEGGKEFAQHVADMRRVLEKFEPLDVALAIAVSDLWPANAASPIKHILAWVILVQLERVSEDRQHINTYEEFKSFAEDLIAAYPDLPMLEDFVPETDWGKVRVPLHDEFVPMFYGSCIERTPDFVEAFRITHADNKLALADMNLAIAIQGYVLHSMPELANLPEPEITGGHIEVPPSEFWVFCRATLLNAQVELKDLRASSSGRLDTRIGAYETPLDYNSFGDACLQGIALPFIGMLFGDRWVPISVRNAPANTIDAWADPAKLVGHATHWSLAKFFRSRFRYGIPGPLHIWVEDREFNLPISCVVSEARLWLFACCSHATVTVVGQQARQLLSAMKPGRNLGFKLDNGPLLPIVKSDRQSPSAKDVNLILVLTLSGTALGFLDAPKKPIRLLSLADLITIFDAIKDLDELERFWKYADSHDRMLNPFSRAPADLFASFRDSNEVLVEGAVTPTLIALDPSWGSSWRYKNLSTFWANAPRHFPDGSIGWLVDKIESGVIEMRSRHNDSLAYSVEVSGCTVQVFMSIDRSLTLPENRLLDLFAQALSDCLQQCRDLVTNLALFERRHVIIQCEIDHTHRLDESKTPDTGLPESPIVTLCSKVSDSPLRLRLRVNVEAVQIGLNEATTAAFEIESLIETLIAVHHFCGWQVAENVLAHVRTTATRPARHHLTVVQESVDIPEYVNPIIPTPTDYKLARRHLAVSMRKLGFAPGRYELKEAKERIDAGREHLRQHIDSLIVKHDSNELARNFLEQHEALVVSERRRVTRTRLSLIHEVDYDRHEAVAKANKEFMGNARHYRYLLEKILSSPQQTGWEPVDTSLLRSLVGLVDWYMVLAGASDTLHNGVDVGGVEIDDSYLAQVFYSPDHEARQAKFEREYARWKLGIGIIASDAVEGDLAKELDSPDLQQAFRKDTGFELRHLLQSLIVLSQPVRHELAAELALSYAASRQAIREAIFSSIEGVSSVECEAIVQFLTISAADIRRLPGRDIDETDVPFWEHTKRLHRYNIRPLVSDGEILRWGAEGASRALQIWKKSVIDGYLPADFPWPEVQRQVRLIKAQIEKDLEIKTEEICRRFTPYVIQGVDFFHRFQKEGFPDAGDFDVLAYWPATNTLVTLECKYNKPAFCIKDSRRLRDDIFGKSETDRKGQFSRIVRRREFVKENRSRMLELLKWPTIPAIKERNVEMYVGRDVHWWMIHPPYPVPTEFVRVDSLDAWLNNQVWSR